MAAKSKADVEGPVTAEGSVVPAEVVRDLALVPVSVSM